MRGQAQDGDARNIINARQAGNTETRASVGYHPWRGGRYDSREDRSPTPEPPGTRVFSQEIRTASFPQRFCQPTSIDKYTGETDPRVWLNDYCLACQLGGATTDEVIIRNLPLVISPLGEHIRYTVRLHFPTSNNMAEYEALLYGIRISIETGIKRLDVRGDSQLVIDHVMKNTSFHDDKMEAYCNAVRALEDKFYSIELNHIPRRYNEEEDELPKIASGRITVPPNVFA
jgi:hypothetical protein